MQPWVQCQSASWTTTLMLRDRSAKSGAEWVSHYLLVVSACMASFLYTPFFMLFLTQSVLCLSCQESLQKQLVKRVQHFSTPKKQLLRERSHGDLAFRPLWVSVCVCMLMTHLTCNVWNCGLNHGMAMFKYWFMKFVFLASETSDSLQNQARHYKTLQDMYKTKARPTTRMVPSSWTLNSSQDGPSLTPMWLRSRTGLSTFLRRIPALENWTM